GMDVLAYSARGDAAAVAALGARAASKDDILRRADVISLHLRLAPETRGFLGRREFAAMKPTAILINTGRGALVEREALVDALTQGKLGAAGLDVFHDEPIKPGDALLALQNVVLSPHNAGQTPEAIRDGPLRGIENVENYLAGKPTDIVVAPVKARRGGARRRIHHGRDVPGDHAALDRPGRPAVRRRRRLREDRRRPPPRRRSRPPGQ